MTSPVRMTALVVAVHRSATRLRTGLVALRVWRLACSQDAGRRERRRLASARAQLRTRLDVDPRDGESERSREPRGDQPDDDTTLHPWTRAQRRPQHHEGVGVLAELVGDLEGDVGALAQHDRSLVARAPRPPPSLFCSAARYRPYRRPSSPRVSTTPVQPVRATSTLPSPRRTTRRARSSTPR